MIARHQVLFILVSFFLVTYGKSIRKDGGQPFELNEFFQGTFTSKTWNGTWITGNSFIFKNDAGDVLKYDVTTNKAEKFLDKSILKNYDGASIALSKDQLYVLIKYNVSSVFRHSTTALFTIYDIQNAKYYDIANKKFAQLATWAPMGHGLVYVLENNIYYLQEPSYVTTPAQITTDGIPGIIYNGAPDWVYEEEVLASDSAVVFSPDAKHIAFASFNDVNVLEFDYVIYGQPGSLKDQYPTVASIKYPKVGTPNPVVETFIADLESMEVKKFDAIPKRFLPADYVLYQITWANNDEVIATVSNRIQNKGELTRCHRNGTCRSEESYEEKSGWLNFNLRYNKLGDKRVELRPQPQGNDYFTHLVLVDVIAKTTKRLTQGQFTVTGIHRWDETKNFIYFSGSGESRKYSQQHVYVVSTVTLEMQCLTCDLETASGPCKFASPSFSKDLSYMVKICGGPGPYLVKIEKTPEIESNKIPEQSLSDSITWEDNEALRQKLTQKLLPTIKDIKVPLPDGFEANARLLLPPGLDENSPQKYPAIVNVYAGPNSNQISDKYTSGFEKYITTNRKYIYIYIDGRGSGRDDIAKMFQVYKKLGTVEIQDQIYVTKYLQQNLKYIDANNTGIWGWSYGGFATAWVMVQDKENVFKFGLSVAPVTSFIYYDSIYTERYMGLPTEDDNLAGYNNTDVTRNVEALRGKTYFIIHGNGDDNVHYQQSMLLSKALENADIPFRQQSYPDENHSLGHVSPHLYHTIDRYFARSMGLPDPPYIRVDKKH